MVQKVKLLATTTKTSVTQKEQDCEFDETVESCPPKTQITYGTRPTDKDISLGRADAFKLVAVFDSEDSSTDASAPTLTLGTITGTFTRGEKITVLLVVQQEELLISHLHELCLDICN